MKDLKTLKAAVASIRLTSKEMKAGRADFVRYMKKSTVLEAEPEVQSFWSRFFALTHRPLAMVSAVLVVFISFGGGVSYAAEQSLPGDLLYPVKIHVNEEVQSLFRFTPKSKAQWEIDRMQRRFEETEALSSEGRLDMETKVQIREDLKVRNEIIKAHVEDLQAEGDETGATEIQTHFDTLFQNHQDAATEVEFEGWRHPPDGAFERDFKPENRPYPPVRSLDFENEIRNEIFVESDIEGDIDSEVETAEEPTEEPEEVLEEAPVEAPILMPGSFLPE